MRKIGVLTSGGDAPGMNAALRAIVRSGLKNKCEMYVIYDGYKGLVEGNIEKVDRNFVSEVLNRGGTIIRSARLPEFSELEVRQKGIEQLKKLGIDSLIAMGGDGTYQGAAKLCEMGLNCVTIPCTIDNDIASSDYTIGFDTCLNTIMECVDKLRDTSSSHSRCSVIEVMGRYCGELALFSGVSCGADIIISVDHPLIRDDVINRVSSVRGSGCKHVIILVTEHLCDVHELARDIERSTSFEARAEVLGRIQRGGSPSAFDRILAAKLGVRAVEILLEGKSNRCVGIRGKEIVDYDILEALKIKRVVASEIVRVIEDIA